VVLKPIEIVRAESEEEHRLTRAAAHRLALRCRDELGATAVYLFGSRARADWHRYSDCDVFVLSDRFEGMKPWESWQLIEPLWDGPVDLQPVGLTPAAFESARNKGGLVSMALADGMLSLLEGPDGRVIPPLPWRSLLSS
jgi:predicted nucleotidyltransferase